MWFPRRGVISPRIQGCREARALALCATASLGWRLLVPVALPFQSLSQERLVTGRPRQQRALCAMAADGGKSELRKHYFGDVYKEGRYEPLHPELFENPHENVRRWLAPTFLSAATAEHPNFKDVLREETPGVFSFDLLSSEFCDLLLEEVDHAQKTAREALDRPNGMNRYGVVLNQLGLEPLITVIQQEYLMPLMASLFPLESQECQDHHTFIVRYKADEDIGLDMHEDDSDVTLNACLGKDFEGATLSFCGLVTDDNHRKMQYTYKHEKGRAVIHLGRHRHGADNIQSGERVNFILWSVSETYRNSEAYRLHRLRSSHAETPDPICLSYTHDRDYTKYLPKPTKAEALSRGVIMEVVERRLDMYQRPVLDLARPIEEINSVPSVCLFMEGLPPPRQSELFQILLQIASEVHKDVGCVEGQVPPIIFFIAVQSSGAVPQVREMSGAMSSPSLVILDVDAEKRYRLDSKEDLDGTAIRNFVAAFRKGELKAEPIGSPTAQNEDADPQKSSEEARPGCTLL
ncbi:unnamed protein product [Durusdinium trenchii]|uniref:Fe2OG dioxygenase domain-containing protein n=1 Tax=Durusdinium trenchii TaxID=1381693 RepID=A0ABP0SMD3_9DINO